MSKVRMNANGATILPQQADEIRELYATGNITYTKLAEQYGVSPQAIGQIVRGQSHQSNVKDKDGWPINNASEQIRILRIKNTVLEKRVCLLESQMWHLKKSMGLPNELNKPEPHDVKTDRWIEGIDRYSDEYIKFTNSIEGLQMAVDLAGEENSDSKN